MPYTPILATLAYIFDPGRTQVLMVHRNRQPGHRQFGKFNGLGGKLEADETIVAGVQREVREEAGIECTELHLAGTISWPGFGGPGHDWFGFLFRVTAFTGTPFTENAEGSLAWVNIGEVMHKNIWPGDRHFLPLIFDPTEPRFHGVMPYHNGEPLSWDHQRLL